MLPSAPSFTVGEVVSAGSAEHVKGPVGPGQLADFAVRSEAPAAVSPGRSGFGVAATIVDGHLRYSALD